MSIAAWWDGGEHVDLPQGRIFVARAGSGPRHATLLHGFPSSSHDWAKVAPGLAGSHTLLMPDFLGFGASAKPKDHAYSLVEQADLVEALWARDGVTSTALAGHDYAVSVVQELLARDLDVELTSVTLLNGGLYPDLHRPQPVQEALADPEQGPRLAAAFNEELLIAGSAPTFGAGYDHTADARDIWQSIARDDGHLVMPALMAYMAERRANEARWVGALEACSVPMAFVWGLQDPVSGGHVVPRLRERLPQAVIDELADVGHWPSLEAPDRVVAALRVR